jgi:hypothetical protein
MATNLLGTLEDIGITTPDGKLVVTQSLPFVEESTVPDTLVLPSRAEFIITDGVIDIDLRETETKGISVLFEFFPAIVGTSPLEYEENPVYSQFAVIPNIATYQFALLFDTGITNDTLATGALRVAKEIFKNDDLTNLIASSLKIYRSDLKPTYAVISDLADNSLWIETLVGRAWIYDLARQYWDSEVLLQSEDVLSITADTTLRVKVPKSRTTNLIRVFTINLEYYLEGLNNGSNYWNFVPKTKNWASPTPAAISGASSKNSSVKTTGARYYESWTVNADFNTDNVHYFVLEATKTLSPGAVSVKVTFEISHTLAA